MRTLIVIPGENRIHFRVLELKTKMVVAKKTEAKKVVAAKPAAKPVSKPKK
jgi:hypothetical protein